MDKTNEPHRVIYITCGKETARVFGNLKMAEEFSADVPGSRIQPAKETYTNPRPMPRWNLQREMVPCACGRTRLKSDSCCHACKGDFRTSNSTVMSREKK